MNIFPNIVWNIYNQDCDNTSTKATRLIISLSKLKSTGHEHNAMHVDSMKYFPKWWPRKLTPATVTVFTNC